MIINTTMSGELNQHLAAGLVTPSGFGNTGVICWFNTLVQSLLSVSVFNDRLVKDRPYLGKNPLAQAWLSMLEESRRGGDIRQHSAKLLKVFTDILSAKGMASCLVGNMQQCANEGFVRFIECFNYAPISAMFSMVYEMSVTCPKCGEQTSLQRDDQVQTLMNTVDVANSEEFGSRVLVHGSTVDEYVCDECIRIHYENCSADCDLPCCDKRGKTCGPKCRGVCYAKSKNIARSERLRTINEVVAVVFPQFCIKQLHQFPVEFTLPKKKKIDIHEAPGYSFVSDGRFVYRAVAQLQHSGSANSGHYWAHGLRADGKYHKLNDEHVSPGNMTPSMATYMVIYELNRIDRAT